MHEGTTEQFIVPSSSAIKQDDFQDANITPGNLCLNGGA
jgi:hypothetical protein